MSENLMEYLIYAVILLFNICDIYAVMFLGNEIKLSTNRLSYCLFECNWMVQSKSIKRTVMIFGELIRQPHQLVVLKIYPVTLETFTRVGFNFIKNIARMTHNFIREIVSQLMGGNFFKQNVA